MSSKCCKRSSCADCDYLFKGVHDFISHSKDSHSSLWICVTCFNYFDSAEKAKLHRSATSHNLPKHPSYYDSKGRSTYTEDTLVVEIKAKECVSFVLMGHVRAGKSTVCRQLLKCSPLPTCQFALDTPMWHFETTKYCCGLIDAPGGRDHIEKMANSISVADCGIMVVDASTGSFEHGLSIDGLMREHFILCATFGIKQIICICNKMDVTSPKYSKARYDEIVEGVASYLENMRYTVEKILFLPVSGLEADNILESSTNLCWYKGPTLLQVLDMVTPPPRLIEKPLRVPLICVQQVRSEPFSYFFGRGVEADIQVSSEPYLFFFGRVEAGVLKPAMELEITPSGVVVTVQFMEINDIFVKAAVPRDVVKFSLLDDASNCVRAGCMFSNPKHNPAREAQNFTSKVKVVDHCSRIINGFIGTLDCNLFHIPVKVSQILSKKHRTSGLITENPDFLEFGEVGLVKIEPLAPIVVEEYSECPPLGRFAVRDERRIVAVGVIKSVEKKVLPGATVGNSAVEN